MQTKIDVINILKIPKLYEKITALFWNPKKSNNISKDSWTIVWRILLINDCQLIFSYALKTILNNEPNIITGIKIPKILKKKDNSKLWKIFAEIMSENKNKNNADKMLEKNTILIENLKIYLILFSSFLPR